MTDQPPPDEPSIFGTPEERAADEAEILAALRLMPTQTFKELAGNTSIDPGYVRLAVGRLAGQGLVDVNLRDGTEYVTLTG